MLIPTPEIDPATRRRLAELDRLRESLGRRVGEPAGWMGTLRRSVRARSAEGSISIEGFHVPEDEVLAVGGDGQNLVLGHVKSLDRDRALCRPRADGTAERAHPPGGLAHPTAEGLAEPIELSEPPARGRIDFRGRDQHPRSLTQMRLDD